ncbi:MAG: DUF4296 domain-containing protein [Bacteroidota bacterium]
MSGRSCQPQEEQFVIPPDKLVRILEDIHVAEAALTGLSTERKDSAAAAYYDQIFTIHQVSASDFDHDLELLKRRPKLLSQTYSTLHQQMEQQTSKQ